MVIKCSDCNEKFEIAEPVKPSAAEKVMKQVLCAECGKNNEILWQKDLDPVSRRYQVG
jgi:DNA-directed RNA polymerase subunit RPC12/RpoP